MTVYNANFDVTYCRHRHRRGELAGPPTIRRVALTVLRTHTYVALVSFPDTEFGLGMIKKSQFHTDNNITTATAVPAQNSWRRPCDVWVMSLTVVETNNIPYIHGKAVGHSVRKAYSYVHCNAVVGFETRPLVSCTRY